MDDCRFDNWTRMFGARKDRRTALKGLAGTGTALFALARAELGLAQTGDVVIEAACFVPGEECNRDNQCCSDKCSHGECKCVDFGKSCQRDAGCCFGRCTNGECKCVGNLGSCNDTKDCCGDRVCKRGICQRR
jgi:hypothetical protein